MTYEEAIKNIRDILAENNSIAPNMTVFDLEKQALYMAIEVLEKQIPKKPLLVPEGESKIHTFKCPTCGSYRIRKFCDDCGQRLDWGDEK